MAVHNLTDDPIFDGSKTKLQARFLYFLSGWNTRPFKQFNLRFGIFSTICKSHFANLFNSFTLSQGLYNLIKIVYGKLNKAY